MGAVALHAFSHIVTQPAFSAPGASISFHRYDDPTYGLLPAVPCRSVLSPLQRSAQATGRAQQAGAGKLHLPNMPSGKGLSRFAATQQDKGVPRLPGDQVPGAGCSQTAAARPQPYSSLHRSAQSCSAFVTATRAMNVSAKVARLQLEHSSAVQVLAQRMFCLWHHLSVKCLCRQCSGAAEAGAGACTCGTIFSTSPG